MSRRAVGIILATIAVVVLAIVVLQQRDPTSAGTAKSTLGLAATPSVVESGQETADRPDSTPLPDGGVLVQTPEIIDPETDKPMIPALALQQGELPWEARIRAVLSQEKLSDPEKARALLEILPSLPAEGAETCAEEAIKRLPSSDYRYAQAAVVNPGTYGLALGVLFADLMDRPEELCLPTLVTIARNSSHPYAEPAKNNLDLLLGKDFGNDWGKWEAAVREKVRGSR